VFVVNFGRSAAGTLTTSVAPAAPAAGQSLIDAIINSRPLANGQSSAQRTRV
jgi:hypothetical protein